MLHGWDSVEGRGVETVQGFLARSPVITSALRRRRETKSKRHLTVKSIELRQDGENALMSA